VAAENGILKSQKVPRENVLVEMDVLNNNMKAQFV